MTELGRIDRKNTETLLHFYLKFKGVKPQVTSNKGY